MGTDEQAAFNCRHHIDHCSYEPDRESLLERAQRGQADAQFELGGILTEGEGVLQNYQDAFKWTRKAAEQGHVDAQSSLGWMYAIGKGVPQNFKEAVKWLQKAAEQGNGFGQSSLGWMYITGKGVSQDYVQAHMWLNLAVSNSGEIEALRESAVKGRDEAEREMSSEQIAEAQRLARKWKPKDFNVE